ncbi:creatininase family protein [Sulfitobacter sp. TSTF-M16]|uniref:Creatininase family protein n=1 Tax=Sulfitobacter aestuariivivens TaxID=2766981 RepID=A0A927D2L6_9RHOB|nr:creatininase family protein [Sulfitobacter aestuariivivens]MBD3662759.1 creatininase family protein [Sulfitobacter aestuariivivens]
MSEVEWQRMKAHEVRACAELDAVVILPIASIEQHGPHLPTMTDTRLGQEVAVRAARVASSPVIVAPVMWAGLSEHHMPFGGTLTLSHVTFRAVLHDLVAATVRNGFKRIVISNSHGGNDLAMQQFCDEISASTPATLVATTYPAEASEEIAALLEDQKGVMHAGEAETSMMMACEGDLVDTTDLAGIAQMEADAPSFLKAGKGSYRWRPFSHLTANGLAGNPARSTPDKGEALLKVSADAIAALIDDPDTWASPQDQRGDGIGGVPFLRDS